jgi:hypothetical protein
MRDFLRRIKPMHNLPWLMMRDFNDTMWRSEHFSETRRNEEQMLDFKEVMFYCDFHDLGYTTPRTFDNKKEEKRNVKVRLDPYCISRLVKHLVGCRR